MLTKYAENRNMIEFVSLEQMVPVNHLLRQIDAAIDFNRIYDFVADLYCKDNGRPSIDPVVLFKIVLIQHIYGIPSLRRTLEEVEMNMAYRWFIGYPINEPVPHFSTVSYNFKHRFNTASVEYVFRWVLQAAADEGYLDTEAVFIDGTHIKANANLKKQARKAVPKEAKRYAHELFEEINKDRESRGKKPFEEDGQKPDREPQMVEKTVSTADPDSGIFHKGEHKKVFAYETHTACDKHNFVLGVHVTPGNVHDSVAFEPLYNDLCAHYPEHKIVAADSAYKTPWICKRIFESGRVLSTAYIRPKTKDGNHPWYEYVYDEYYDDVICPEYKALHYSTTNREGYREYKSRSYLCKDCPTRAMCTQSAKCEKAVARHKYIAKHGMPKMRFHDLRHSCASLLLANGVPLKQIQEWLGHSDFSTTANIYAHLDYRSKISSAQAMEQGILLPRSDDFGSRWENVTEQGKITEPDLNPVF